MSAHEMLAPGMREAEAEEYLSWLGQDSIQVSGTHAQEVCDAVRDPIYGHVVGATLEYLRTYGVPAGIAALSARVLCITTTASSRMYGRDTEGVRRPQGWGTGSIGFRESLRETQAAMASAGVIHMLPAQYAMTESEGRQQVELANRQLSNVPAEVGNVLAAANYSLYFSAHTMANGEDLLRTGIDDVVESEEQEKMPHLTRTNLAIGQLLAHIGSQMEGRLTVIDSGAGTGATLSAGISALNEGFEYPETSILAIEPNPDFFAELQDLANRIIPRIRAINHNYRLLTLEGGALDAGTNTLALANTSLEQAVKNLVVPQPSDKNDLTVVTANYVWHRLPAPVKSQVISEISQRSTNSMFLIADLMQNGSEVNRRYFNFGNNGPLNCGNLDLKHIFHGQGYEVRKLGHDFTPSTVHPKLVEKISQEADNDGHLWVACKGSEAERLVMSA